MINHITLPRFSRPQFLTWRHLLIIFGMVGTGVVNPTDMQVSDDAALLSAGAFFAFALVFVLFVMPAFRKEAELFETNHVDNGHPYIASEAEAEQHQHWIAALPFMRGHRGGYVYIIRDIDVTGFYKIGKTNQPSRRLNEFVAQYPFRFMVTHIIVCRDMTAVETLLHRHFADKRARGEWFSLTPDDVRWIKRLETC